MEYQRDSARLLTTCHTRELTNLTEQLKETLHTSM